LRQRRNEVVHGGLRICGFVGEQRRDFETEEARAHGGERGRSWVLIN
jgi:hypothetical protein